EGLDRETVRRDAAVAAALADELVDDDTPGRIREFVALPAATLLGRAGLHIDDRRHALLLAQLALHGVELFAGPEGDARCPVEPGRERLLFVDDRHDIFH